MMTTTSISKRLDYVDTTRTLAIFLVIMGHIDIYIFQVSGTTVWPQFTDFLCTFHMPVFFVLSGILYNANKWNSVPFFQFIISRIKSLLIPYVLFEFVGGIFKLLVMKSTPAQLFYTFITGRCIVPANWFLVALFIGEIVFYLHIKFYHKYLNLVPLAIILLLTRYAPIQNHYANVICRGLVAYIFLYLGFKLKDYFLSPDNARWDIIILSFLMTYFITRFNSRVDLWNCTINNPILYFLGGLVGSYFLIGLSKNIHNKLVSYIGQNTIAIVGTHQLIFEPLRLYTNIGHGMIDAAIVFTIIFIVEFIIIYLLNKYFPIMLGKFPRKTA